MTDQGRQARGERNGQSKLTEHDVRTIPTAYTGRYGEVIGFARQYGVSVYTIREIVNGEL